MRELGLCLASLVCVGVVSSSITLAQSASSHVAPGADAAGPRSQPYEEVQHRLARGWNTWDVHSVTTQVLLPEGLAIHVGMKHNSSLNGDAFLGDTLIGRLEKDAEVVTPGPHAWDGSYTDFTVEWKGHKWRLQTAHDGEDLVMVVTPLPLKQPAGLPPTVVFSVNFLWDRPGTAAIDGRVIQTRGGGGLIPIYCTCDSEREAERISLPVGEPYFAADLTGPIAISTRKRRSLKEVNEIIQRAFILYAASNSSKGQLDPIRDAIETTLGWDTIYEPDKQRVISPVSRVWSVNWGGYVLFDWDTFFAATMAGIGDKDLAYANVLETLREETPQGFVPNYARAGNWKSTDRSEPPVGAITVLALYRKFHDRWFLEDAFAPLLSWNRWWNEHRQMQGYIVLGSDPQNEPANLDDGSRGTWQGAVYESGLDNSPMYDGTFYNPQTHLLEYADVGMTSLYIADCDALAEIADTLGKATEAKELGDRANDIARSWRRCGMKRPESFSTKICIRAKFNTRLSPTNFYPLLAKAATPEQAQSMINHLVNREEFGSDWIMPSIARNDPAFKDQQYWRGRVWGPMNYLVYLGLKNYPYPRARKEFAEKSYELFVKEWREKGHVHENYNAITGSGDDVESSDRFYHWGALLGYVEYLEQTEVRLPSK